MANHLEDQESAVNPAAATEGKPTETPVETNGESKSAAESGDGKAGEARPERSARAKAAEPKTNGRAPAGEAARKTAVQVPEVKAAEPKPIVEAAPAPAVEAAASATACCRGHIRAAGSNSNQSGDHPPRRGRHSIGNTGAQGQRNGATTLDLVELKDMSIQALNQIAKDLGVPGRRRPSQAGTHFQDSPDASRKERADLLRRRSRMPARWLRLSARTRIQLFARSG